MFAVIVKGDTKVALAKLNAQAPDVTVHDVRSNGFGQTSIDFTSEYVNATVLNWWMADGPFLAPFKEGALLYWRSI